MRVKLARWLLGSGRYQAHFWPLMVHEAEFGVCPPEDRASARREIAARILARWFEDFDEFASRLWQELDFNDELQAEAMRMYATEAAARAFHASGMSLSSSLLRGTRDDLAIAHGATGWRVLAGAVEDGLLYGFLPFDWVERSAQEIARARQWADSFRAAP
jgi:hypothetical protein